MNARQELIDRLKDLIRNAESQADNAELAYGLQSTEGWWTSRVEAEEIDRLAAAMNQHSN